MFNVGVTEVVTLVHVVNGETDFCHTIAPTEPDKVKVVPVPVHTVVFAAETVPAVAAVATTNDTALDVAEEQAPLVTNTLKYVSAVTLDTI